jgi:hypothetical protein
MPGLQKIGNDFKQCDCGEAAPETSRAAKPKLAAARILTHYRKDINAPRCHAHGKLILG